MKKRRVPRQRLLKLIDRYKKKFKLNDYEIDIIISEDHKFIVTDTIKEDVSSRADVTCTNYEQNFFTIVFYNFSNLEHDVIHELLHIKFWDLLEGPDSKYEFSDDLYDLEHDIIDLLVPTYMSK